MSGYLLFPDQLTSAKLMVGLYLFQGIVSTCFPHKIIDAKHMKKGTIDEVMNVDLTRGYGIQLVIAGILGWFQIYYSDEVYRNTALFCAFFPKFLYNVWKLGEASSRGDAPSSLRAQMISPTMSLLVTLANLVEMEYALGATKCITLIGLLNGISFVMNPHKALRVWKTPPNPSTSVLTRAKMLGYDLLIAMTIAYCVTTGVRPLACIGYGSIFYVVQVFAFMFISKDFYHTHGFFPTNTQYRTVTYLSILLVSCYLVISMLQG